VNKIISHIGLNFRERKGYYEFVVAVLDVMNGIDGLMEF